MKSDGSDGSAPIGARNDNSSLFSLESLKRAEEEAAKKPKATDDSGLIDLKALASLEKSADKGSSGAAVASVVAPDLFQMSAPIAPIAAPSMAAIQAAPAGMADEVPKSKSKTPLIIGGAIAAVLLAAGAFALTRGSGDATTTAATATATAATATAAPKPTATEAPAEEPKVAAVTPGQRAAKEEPPKPEPTAAKPAAAPAPQRPAAAPKPAAAAAPAPAAKPAAPAESCDLACQMQRAVNKKK